MIRCESWGSRGGFLNLVSSDLSGCQRKSVSKEQRHDELLD